MIYSMNDMNYKNVDHTDPFGDSFKKHSSKKKKNNRLVYFIFFLIIIVVFGFLYLFYVSDYKETFNQRKIERQTRSLIRNVSKIAILPNENPVIFTITDIDALLKEQAFFANSQNGDTLLIFPEAMKAVIYSEERKLVVNMGPVTSNEPISSSQGAGIQERQIQKKEIIEEETPLTEYEQVEEQDQNQIIEN